MEGRRPALRRTQVLPRPPLAELSAMPLHVILADFPETLGELKREGVEVAELGGRRAAAVLGESTLAAIHARLEWREETDRATDDAEPESR